MNDKRRFDEALELVNSKQWHHKFEVYPGIVTPGGYCPEGIFENLMCLPADMTGMRVLDIGARDGYYSFACERRNADVVAIDIAADTAFDVAKYLLNSKIEMINMSLFDIPKINFGKFDIVLFLGIFYHLHDPIKALQIIRSISASKFYLETICITTQFHTEDTSPVSVPLLEYVTSNEWKTVFKPNREAIRQMLQDTGFCVKKENTWGDRLLVEADVI